MFYLGQELPWGRTVHDQMECDLEDVCRLAMMGLTRDGRLKQAALWAILKRTIGEDRAKEFRAQSGFEV